MFAFVAHLKQEECTVQAAFHVLEQVVQEILKCSNQPRFLDQQHAALSLLTQAASDTSQVSAIAGFAFVSPHQLHLLGMNSHRHAVRDLDRCCDIEMAPFLLVRGGLIRELAGTARGLDLLLQRLDAPEMSS